MNYKQYSIVVVNLNPTIGSEINKTRPCLIISPTEMNYQNIIVAPITSTQKDYPTRVQMKKDSFIVLDQIRTISKKRIIKESGSIDQKTITEVKKVLKEMLID